MPRAPAAAFLGPGLVSRRLVVASADALLVKALVEGYEGVAAVFGESGGDLTLAAPCDREGELDEIVAAVRGAIEGRGGLRS